MKVRMETELTIGIGIRKRVSDQILWFTELLELVGKITFVMLDGRERQMVSDSLP